MSDLRELLQSIYDEHGKLTPGLVLDTARDPEHPLHNRFEWDDAAAAEQWRTEQARHMIQSVHVVRSSSEELHQVREWQAVRQADGFAYHPAEKVAQDPVMSRIVLQDMEREWRQLRRRYQQYSEFAAMVRRDLDDEAA